MVRELFVTPTIALSEEKKSSLSSTSEKMLEKLLLSCNEFQSCEHVVCRSNIKTILFPYLAKKLQKSLLELIFMNSDNIEMLRHAPTK